jgi:GGDEF domain-containing protein
MNLDLMTVSVMTSFVVVVAGVMFMLETLLREDDSVSKIWSLGFLSGILSSVAYMVWALDPAIWWSVAIGNATLVSCGGFMWLGCRRFNERSMRGAVSIVVVFSVVAAAAALIEREANGGWAGATMMFAGIVVLAGAAAGESLRGALGRLRITVVLAVVFGLESAYYLSRIVVFMTAGPENELFVTWWGTIPTSFVTIVLTIVAVVLASVLRAERVALRGRDELRRYGMVDGVLDAESFGELLTDGLRRVSVDSMLFSLISVRIRDLKEIASAFGPNEARRIRNAARRAIRAGTPVQAWIGVDGDDGFIVAVVVGEKADARSTADALCRSIRAALKNAGTGASSGASIGLTFSDDPSVDATELIRRAREAGDRADQSDSVVVVEM